MSQGRRSIDITLPVVAEPGDPPPAAVNGEENKGIGTLVRNPAVQFRETALFRGVIQRRIFSHGPFMSGINALTLLRSVEIHLRGHPAMHAYFLDHGLEFKIPVIGAAGVYGFFCLTGGVARAANYMRLLRCLRGFSFSSVLLGQLYNLGVQPGADGHRHLDDRYYYPTIFTGGVVLGGVIGYRFARANSASLGRCILPEEKREDTRLWDRTYRCALRDRTERSGWLMLDITMRGIWWGFVGEILVSNATKFLSLDADRGSIYRWTALGSFFLSFCRSLWGPASDTSLFVEVLALLGALYLIVDETSHMDMWPIIGIVTTWMVLAIGTLGVGSRVLSQYEHYDNESGVSDYLSLVEEKKEEGARDPLHHPFRGETGRGHFAGPNALMPPPPDRLPQPTRHEILTAVDHKPVGLV
jgi:hypothetical protein